MGCNLQAANSNFQKNERAALRNESVIGKGIRVSKDGNVNLSFHRLASLDGKIVNNIAKNKLHHTAKSLQLTGNQLYFLGKDILLLQSLESIDLENNLLRRVPDALSHLENLKELNLSNNPFEEKAFVSITRIQNLKYLALRNCSLATVPKEVSQCTLLEELDVSDNPGISFPECSFQNISHLKTLYVINCSLKGDELPLAIQNLKELIRLDISGNKFQLDNVHFFGNKICSTLKVLCVRSMNFSFLPKSLATLRELHSVDLSENAVVNLDVLAGRSLMRQSAAVKSSLASNPLQSEPFNESEPLDCFEREESESAFSRQGSLSGLSKACRISTILQPITLKCLCLRHCNLKTVPKYFHKLTSLEELDISENEELDDPNMTLFSLVKLRVLSIVGCPFAVSLSTSRNEWYDISKLRNLTKLDWTIWKANNNTAAYSTRIPVEICGLQLQNINDVQLRKGIFVGDPLETIINILNDAYFKVDLAMDEATVHSYIEALEAFEEGPPFFFPTQAWQRRVQEGTKDSIVMNTGEESHQSTSPNQQLEALLNEIASARLRIVLSRYIFFLTLQATNCNKIIPPPLDVMILHYAHLVANPVSYRKDCEAICGRIISCPYRNFFLYKRIYPDEANKACRESEWHSIPDWILKTCPWLQYDFWGERSKNRNTSLPPSSSTFAFGLPSDSFVSQEAAESELSDLKSFDTVKDLACVLDSAITDHFSSKPFEIYVEVLKTFFSTREVFCHFKNSIREMPMDWSRYVKFLCLCSLHNCKKQEEGQEKVESVSSTSEFKRVTTKRTTSLLGERYDELEELEALEGIPSHRVSSIIRNNTQCVDSAKQFLNCNPVPTIGILYVLHAHRTAHDKYYQILSLLGLEATDVTWEDTKFTVESTSKAWELLFTEKYERNEKNMFFYELKDNLPPREKISWQLSKKCLTAACNSSATENLQGILRKKYHRKSAKVTFYLGNEIY